MPKSTGTQWKWKDSNRYWWTMRVWHTGEIIDLDESGEDGDWRWKWELLNELGKVVWVGYHTGQLDQPPKLRHLLAEWQAEVNQIVIDGVVDETRVRYSNADEPKVVSEKLA